jgi:hypothetical protein
MSGKVFHFSTDHLAKPFPDLWTVNVVIINPTLISRIVRWVNINALNFSGIVGEQSFEGHKVISFDKEVAASCISN